MSSSDPLTPEQQLDYAKKGLRHIWNRWNEEPDEAQRSRIWLLVIEAELRLERAKISVGALKEGVCPACQSTMLFKFKDDEGLLVTLCKRCGWGNRDDLRELIRSTAKRMKR
jgi:Zn ribbon nucleic-acid-binding protein